jgi:hypothetical protein
MGGGELGKIQILEERMKKIVKKGVLTARMNDV